MVSDATAHLGWTTDSRDVVVLRWPEQAGELERLNALGIPRLLLVEPGAPSPSTESPIEDWLRLPANDGDVRARLLTLAKRAELQPNRPTLDAYGQLTYRGRTLLLSPLDQRVVERLIDSWGGVVETRQLRDSVWTDGATVEVLRVHVSRLRHRLALIGLTISSVRGKGYALRVTAPG